MCDPELAFVRGATSYERCTAAAGNSDGQFQAGIKTLPEPYAQQLQLYRFTCTVVPSANHQPTTMGRRVRRGRQLPTIGCRIRRGSSLPIMG
eukprot:365791-Chlamydomonas_euryale.AAC.2